MTSPANIYGLIGYPLGHSFSQDFFNRKFEAENIDARYVNFEIRSIDEFPGLISDNPALKGLNVTIPYKRDVIAALDEIDDEARRVGAVNVIKFERREGKTVLRGYNSDVIGFRDSLTPLLTDSHKAALVLGSGGAAKAVRYVLETLGIEALTVSRTPGADAISYKEVDAAIIGSHHLIVNTTPLGMYPHVDECPDIPYHLLTPDHLCYDLLYNPDVTLFMKKSSQAGAVVKNGLEMLLLQAFAAWEIWRR